jgi:hypothetical protein
MFGYSLISNKELKRLKTLDILDRFFKSLGWFGDKRFIDYLNLPTEEQLKIFNKWRKANGYL